MEEKVDDTEATPAATATPPKQSSSSSSSLREFFEESCAKRGASSEDDKHTTNSGISSKASSSSGAENWANFELVTISASSTISFDRPPPSSNDCSSSTSFVVFESSWRAWLLGGNQTFNSNISTVSSVLVDDDDGWMSQLLPLRHHQERQQHANHHPKIPPLQRNPRDCTIHHRFQADPGLLFERSGVSHYHHYQAAYVANATSSETSNFDSEHHLSNEEWIAQRRRRDGNLRRRYQQEVERMLGLEQVVFSSSPEDTRNRTNLDQHQQQRFVRRIVADGQTLLSIDPQLENDASSSGTMDSEEHSSRPTGPETPSSSIVHSLSPSPSPTRPTQRFRARRLPITSQARREQFQHWSSSAVQRSLDVVLVPWRMVFRNDEDNTNNRNVDNHIALVMAEDDERSFSDDTSGRAISSDANSISQGDEAVNELPPWPSGRGWRPGQNDDSDGDNDERNGDSDESTGGTGYWSTGTAMETDYESSSLSGSIGCHDHREVDEEWEDGLMQFPSVEEEDPHQYEFMPTPEDPLFPDDPFSESF